MDQRLSRRNYAPRVDAPVVSPPLTHLPNALTIARLVAIPVFIWLVVTAEGGHSWAAAIVFGLAGLTDQLDGWLARRWHVESAFGKVADPLADRLMIDAAVILLLIAGRLPWIAVLILLRDVLLVGGYKVLVPRGLDFSVNFVGKAATWLLYAGLAFVLATHAGTSWPLWIFWTGIVLALVAFALYLRSAWKVVRA
jgi:CDP-diacylglycerol--glycerol-3-phosphate 3-phosphatidyltransferase